MSSIGRVKTAKKPAEKKRKKTRNEKNEKKIEKRKKKSTGKGVINASHVSVISMLNSAAVQAMMKCAQDIIESSSELSHDTLSSLAQATNLQLKWQ